MAPRRSSQSSPAKKALAKVKPQQKQQQQQQQGDGGEQTNILSQQQLQLAILRISEPIAALSSDLLDHSNGDGNRSPSKRTSDASSSGADTGDSPPTPASLEADLTHYKELFSKLRFSYLEQVTKEKFLRAIVGDPPLIVGHNENVELETELAQVKQQLKQRKEDVRLQVEEMEKMGRDLARRYKQVQLQRTQLAELPASIENLEATIASLREAQAAHATNTSSSDPNNPASSSSQNLSLPATLSLLAEREAELATLDRQLASVQNTLPRKTREAEAMERELAVLQRRKGEAIAQAQEAKRKKREGESDGLEEMGRWYRGAEQTLKQLVDVEN